MISTQVSNNLVEVVHGKPQRQTGSLGRQELDRRAEAERQETARRAAAATAHGLEPITHPRTVEDSLPADALESINNALWGGISDEARALALSYAEITEEK